MRLKSYCFLLFLTIVSAAKITNAGVLKSLDRELTSLVESTESYLVTVKGDGGWRNLIATGIIVDPRGYLITSSQVFESSSFEVIRRNGRSFTATKVGVDYQTGLAVLKMVGDGFSPPIWGKSESLKKGSLITVVGNSYGIPSTVFFGSYHGTTDEGLLRITVDASPGVSGGAILDIDGNLVGILVARESSSGPVDSLHFASVETSGNRLLYNLGNANNRCYAIPAQVAREVARLLINDGKVSRGYLGITSQTVRNRVQTSTGAPGGVRITNIEIGSPAQKAGLQKDDIIVTVDSRAIQDRASLIKQVRAHKPHETVLVEYSRNGEHFLTAVELGEARETPFLSGLELSQTTTIRNGVDAKPSNITNSSLSEVQQLRAEVSRLQTEIQELKQKLGNYTASGKNP